MTILTGSAQHKNGQLKAVALLVLAGFVMLICLTQRSSIVHHIQVEAAALSRVTESGAQKTVSPALSPCELNAHSLLAAQPLYFDTILLFPGLLVLILLAVVIKISVLPKPVILFRPPPLRIHLKNCVFRE